MQYRFDQAKARQQKNPAFWPRCLLLPATHDRNLYAISIENLSISPLPEEILVTICDEIAEPLTLVTAEKDPLLLLTQVLLLMSYCLLLPLQC